MGYLIDNLIFFTTNELGTLRCTESWDEDKKTTSSISWYCHYKTSILNDARKCWMCYQKIQTNIYREIATLYLTESCDEDEKLHLQILTYFHCRQTLFKLHENVRRGYQNNELIVTINALAPLYYTRSRDKNEKLDPQ